MLIPGVGRKFIIKDTHRGLKSADCATYFHPE